MKVLFWDFGTGAAGDMLAGALLGLLEAEERATVVTTLNGLGLPGVAVACEEGASHGLAGLHFSVRVHGEEEDMVRGGGRHDHGHGGHGHVHRTLAEVLDLLAGLPLDAAVKADVAAVYRLLAEAEGKVHGATPGEVHFHEVGMLDAIVDIAATCLLMARIAPDQVVATPVQVGSGTVRCAHGILPVPAPATALLLQGIPAYGGEIAGELCTPTGAALLRHFVQAFGPMPPMRTERIGIGLGTRDIGRPSAVRAFLGESVELASRKEPSR